MKRPLDLTAPREVYLLVSDEESGDPFPPNHDDISWCAEPLLAEHVRYIRADLVGDPPVAPGCEGDLCTEDAAHTVTAYDGSALRLCPHHFGLWQGGAP